MMMHDLFVASTAIAFYDTGSTKPDIVIAYTGIINNIRKGKRKFDLVVKYGWLKKQPETIDSKVLAYGNE